MHVSTFYSLKLTYKLNSINSILCFSVEITFPLLQLFIHNNIDVYYKTLTSVKNAVSKYPNLPKTASHDAWKLFILLQLIYKLYFLIFISYSVIRRRNASPRIGQRVKAWEQIQTFLKINQILKLK